MWKWLQTISPIHSTSAFSQNNLGLNEDEVVFLLTRLDLHGSSQAGDEVGSASFPLHFARFFKSQDFFFDIAWYYSLLRDWS